MNELVINGGTVVRQVKVGPCRYTHLPVGA
jgi:hypothetical protein